VYINETDKDGFPTGKQILVQGGIEYLNNTQTGTINPQKIENTMQPKIPAYYEEQGQIQHTTTPQTDNTLKTLGLDFINIQPTPPTLTVKIAFKGPVNFSIPLPTHKIIITPLLVILVTDKRTPPTAAELGTQIDGFQAELIMPDNKIFPITPPSPNVVTFNIGALHCSLFVRLNTPTFENTTQQIPQPQITAETGYNDDGEITPEEIAELLSR
jgi:hypothetical protein